MTLEIIATNLKDVKDAAAFGADRLELSPSMSELGITPSYGLIQLAVEAVEIPINVIVRPHSQSFLYNEDDVATMITDIEMIKSLGANGIVIGPLTAEHTIDEEVLKRLLWVAGDLDITIHRAFDFARDQKEALECLANYPQVKTILTSGGQRKATEAITEIRELIALSADTHLTVMAGHGLRVDSFEDFYKEIQPTEVHFGSGARINESFSEPINRDAIKSIKSILR